MAALEAAEALAAAKVEVCQRAAELAQARATLAAYDAISPVTISPTDCKASMDNGRYSASSIDSAVTVGHNINVTDTHMYADFEI